MTQNFFMLIQPIHQPLFKFDQHTAQVNLISLIVIMA